MTLAAIDVGTNTAKMLVAEVDGGTLRPRAQVGRYVRLGEQLGATGRIGPAAMERLRKALVAFQEVAAEHGAEIAGVYGTSASRDAANRDELVDFVRRETGLRYDVLSGEEEARWTYAGTRLPFADLERPCVVLDIGGGSTEFVLGASAAQVVYWRSLQVGTVRLTERFFEHQPPAEAAVGVAEEAVRQGLDAIEVPLHAGTPLVGGSGTIRVLAKIAGQPIPGELPSGAVRSWRDRLLAMTREEVLALDPRRMQGRADVFPAGVLILDAVMQRFGFAACRVSPCGLRHGLVLRACLGEGEREKGRKGE